MDSDLSLYARRSAKATPTSARHVNTVSALVGDMELRSGPYDMLLGSLPAREEASMRPAPAAPSKPFSSEQCHLCTPSSTGPTFEAATPKVQAIPSLFASSDATERASAMHELGGYLPPVDFFDAAPLTALKKVRDKLRQTLPDLSDEVMSGHKAAREDATTAAQYVSLDGSSVEKGKGTARDDHAPQEQTLFGGFQATRNSYESAGLAYISDDSAELADLKQQVQELDSKIEAAKKSDSEEKQTRTGSMNSWTEAVAQGASKLHMDFSSIPPMLPSRSVPQSTKQPSTLPLDLETESFADLNDRLKAGSRLSAILGNKADFRSLWASMNTALPRDINTRDFVKLVTPGTSPTKPTASTPEPSNSQVSARLPWNAFADPPEALSDYYMKGFQALSPAAQEVIMKAQKTFMPPAAPAKKPFDPADYTRPFCEFLTENPTVFHAVDYFAIKLTKAGFEKLSERDLWTDKLEAGGKYFVERNGSSLIAFSVGKAYESGNGIAMIAAHVDAVTARLKPVSTKKTRAGYVQLGVAPYAGALNPTWWDRDLGIGGRVLVKDEKTGKISTKLVKLGWPIARVPTLAPHFGVGIMGANNAETQAVPIIGLDNSDLNGSSKEDGAEWKASALLGSEGTFAATQPPKLLKAIAGELNLQNFSSIVNWELELFDTQPAQVGGLEKEFIFAGRIDDKLCSWAAVEALLAASESPAEDAGIVNLVGVFDDEEIGSLLRQGAKGNFLPSVIERITESFSESESSSSNLLFQTYANSFLVSADVTHAVNPNFLEKYLEDHAPRLNVGVVVSADSNGHMTTDSVSTSVMQRIAEKSGNVLQLFMIRNDSRSGGTVGPMLSSAMGVRAIDMGIPQLSMHSVRATTGSLDPGLGVKLFTGFLDGFEAVDKEFA